MYHVHLVKTEASADKEAQVKPSVPGMGGGMVPQEVRDMLSAQLRAELARTEIQLKELEVSLELLDRQRKLEDEPNGDDTPASVVRDRQVERARSDLASAEVRAPVKGRVLSVSVHAGEVSPGPLLTLGDLQIMVARAEGMTMVPAASISASTLVRIASTSGTT